MTVNTNLFRFTQKIQPVVIYNFAAISHIAVSLETNEFTCNPDALGTFNNYRYCSIIKNKIKNRIYQASIYQNYMKITK